MQVKIIINAFYNKKKQLKGQRSYDTCQEEQLTRLKQKFIDFDNESRILREKRHPGKIDLFDLMCQSKSNTDMYLVSKYDTFIWDLDVRWILINLQAWGLGQLAVASQVKVTSQRQMSFQF